jgi:hypothetical protein
VPLFDELQLQQPASLAEEWDHRYQQQQLEALSELTCSVHQEAELGQLRALLLVRGRPGWGGDGREGRWCRVRGGKAGGRVGGFREEHPKLGRP